MNRRTAVFLAVVVIAGEGTLLGCGTPGEAETAEVMLAKATASLDCPADRVATVTDLHRAGGVCADTRQAVGENLESHHYRVACEALQGARPARVEAVQASACREDDRGAWTDVEICCPAIADAAHTASMSGRPTPSRRMRLAVQAPAVGKVGTASISLLSPPGPTDYNVRIAPESCDVYQLHPSRNCEADGSYAPGETTTFMVRYTPGSTHRRGGVLIVDFVDPTLSDVEVRLSGGVGDGDSDWLSVPVERR